MRYVDAGFATTSRSFHTPTAPAPPGTLGVASKCVPSHEMRPPRARPATEVVRYNLPWYSTARGETPTTPGPIHPSHAASSGSETRAAGERPRAGSASVGTGPASAASAAKGDAAGAGAAVASRQRGARLGPRLGAAVTVTGRAPITGTASSKPASIARGRRSVRNGAPGRANRIP